MTQARFIPACAGNTERTSFSEALTTVHPRLCGEHNFWSEMDASEGGSSPPVRGTLR